MAWVFSPGRPCTTWAPASSSDRAQPMLRRSSKRAFSSTRHTACLPRSAASISVRHQRRVVGRAVHGHLDGQHVGVVHGLLHEPLDAAGERVVGVVHQDVARAHGGEHVGLAVVCGERAARSTGVQGARAARRSRRGRGSATGRSGRAARRRPRPRPPRSRAARSGTRAGRGRSTASTSSRTTSPKRRWRSSFSTARSRSSASSETSKSASRATRKKAWRSTSMPGNRASRWRAITASSGTNVFVAEVDEPRQHLLRHLHAREQLACRSPGRAARRRGSARGSRCRGTAAPGRRRAG